MVAIEGAVGREHLARLERQREARLALAQRRLEVRPLARPTRSAKSSRFASSPAQPSANEESACTWAPISSMTSASPA